MQWLDIAEGGDQTQLKVVNFNGNQDLLYLSENEIIKDYKHENYIW